MGHKGLVLLYPFLVCIYSFGSFSFCLLVCLFMFWLDLCFVFCFVCLVWVLLFVLLVCLFVFPVCLKIKRCVNLKDNSPFVTTPCMDIYM